MIAMQDKRVFNYILSFLILHINIPLMVSAAKSV